MSYPISSCLSLLQPPCSRSPPLPLPPPSYTLLLPIRYRSPHAPAAPILTLLTCSRCSHTQTFPTLALPLTSSLRCFCCPTLPLPMLPLPQAPAAPTLTLLPHSNFSHCPHAPTAPTLLLPYAPAAPTLTLLPRSRCSHTHAAQHSSCPTLLPDALSAQRCCYLTLLLPHPPLHNGPLPNAATA